jgi:hypothetical protein
MQLAHIHGVLHMFGVTHGKNVCKDTDDDANGEEKEGSVWFRWRVLQDTCRLVMQGMSIHQQCFEQGLLFGKLDYDVVLSQESFVTVKQGIQCSMLVILDQLVQVAYWYAHPDGDRIWAGAGNFFHNQYRQGGKFYLVPEACELSVVDAIFNRYKGCLHLKRIQLDQLNKESVDNPDSLSINLSLTEIQSLSCVILDRYVRNLEPCSVMQAMSECDALLSNVDKKMLKGFNQVLSWIFGAQFKAAIICLQSNESAYDKIDKMTDAHDQYFTLRLLREVLKLCRDLRRSQEFGQLKDIARIWCKLDENQQIDFRGKSLTVENISGSDNSKIWGETSYCRAPKSLSANEVKNGRAHKSVSTNEVKKKNIYVNKYEFLLFVEKLSPFPNIWGKRIHHSYSHNTNTKDKTKQPLAVVHSSRLTRHRLGKELIKLDILVRFYTFVAMKDNMEIKRKQDNSFVENKCLSFNVEGKHYVMRDLLLNHGFQLLIGINQAFIESTRNVMFDSHSVMLQKLKYLEMLLFWSQRAYELVLMQEYEIPLWIESILVANKQKLDSNNDQDAQTCLKSCQQYFTACNQLVFDTCLSLELIGSFNNNGVSRFGEIHLQSLEVVAQLEKFEEKKEQIQVLMVAAAQQCRKCINY